MKNKMTKILTLVLAGVLASCSSIEKPNIPQNYTDAFVQVQGQSGPVTVNFNTLDQYYKAFTDQNDVTLNNLLLLVAQKVSNGEITNRKNDGEVLRLLSSVEGDDQAATIQTYFQTASSTGNTLADKSTLTFNGIGEEVLARGQKALKDKITGGTYNYNDRFDQNKLIKEINKDQLITLKSVADGNADASTSLNYSDMKVINKTTSFQDLFTQPGNSNLVTGTANYTQYMQDVLYSDIIRNKLTAQYIYNEKFGNISLAQMQKLNVLTIKDRTDVSGAARKFINAYYTTYTQNLTSRRGTAQEGIGTIDVNATGPIEEMEKLWNGIGAYNDQARSQAIYTQNSSTLTQGKGNPANLDPALLKWGWNDQFNNYLTNEQIAWLNTNQIDTLFDQIVDNYYKAKVENDQTQYDSFSATRTQEIQKGLVSQIDGLLKADNRQEGIFTKSSLSGVDATVTDRVFNNYATGLTRSFTTDETDRQTNPFYFPEVSESSVSAPVFFASGSYTFVELETNFNSATLGTTKEDNASKGAAAQTAAMDAAYQMVGEGNYKNDGIVYWLKNFAGKNNNFTVNNQAFMDYMKNTYPDLFDDSK